MTTRKVEVIDLLDDDEPELKARRGAHADRRATPASAEIILLDDSDEEDAAGKRGASAPSAPPRAKSKDTEPSWLKWNGVKRVMAEFGAMQELIAQRQLPVERLEMVGDDAMRWRFRIRQFDDAVPGGRALNRDLAELKRRHGHDHVLMEIGFPRDYPTSPLALRVVLPRMRWYTGHVTAGGSVCMEMLTTSGTANSWQASFTVEGVLLVALANMIDCESTVVRTATGPGGRSGPLRIDLRSEYGHPPLTEYSEAEASAAFSRMLQHHRRNGW